MYILKNSIKNLFRNKGRNIIVGIIILAMLSFTAISMIISSATDSVIKNYKEQFGSEIYLQYDENKIKEDEKNSSWADIPELTDDTKINLSDSKYLKETKIKVMYEGYTNELSVIPIDKVDTNSQGIAPSGSDAYYYPNITVYGYNTPDLMKDFKEGKRKITSGLMFENNNECVVSEDFAELNNLSVGDVISIDDCDKNANFNQLELKISGIFFDFVKKHSSIGAANSKNDILTTYETMKLHQENAKTRLYAVDATYYLKSPDMLEAFNKEAHEKGLHKNYMMSTDEISYNKIVKPAENLANISNFFLIAVLIIGFVVLVLLSIMSIRERKYEIGVLRAMGMKKLEVVRGLLYESLITVSLCLILGLSIGAFAAQPISDMIMQNQQEKSTGFGGVQVTQEEIKVTLTPKAIADVSAIALILAAISSSMGVLYILRYEPMKILTERN